MYICCKNLLIPTITAANIGLIFLQQASVVAGRALDVKNMQHLLNRAIMVLGQGVSLALFSPIIFVWQAVSLVGDLLLRDLIS